MPVNSKTVQCLNNGCDGTVRLNMEWEAPESNWGADADGNRGIYVAGHWNAYVQGNMCSKGHVLYPDEMMVIEQTAMDDAMQEMDDEYDGPDYDDIDD